MAGLWYAPERPAFFTAAGGEASLGDIYAAARDAAVLVDNSFAASAALERAYAGRNARIFALTGERLDNPLTGEVAATTATGAFLPLAPVLAPAAIGQATERARRIRDWQARVRDLAQRRPELAAELMPATTVEDEALAISRDAEERFTRLAGSRDGAGKWLAVLAAGVTGGARDPLQVASWALGGGPGAARTVAGRIGMTLFSEAAVNAGVELALQPIVQAYRARAGLDSGMGEAFRNAAFAGALGGLLGGAGRSLTELLARGGKSGMQAALAADAPPETIRAIEAEAAAAAPALRDGLPLEGRGAVDAMELDTHTMAQRPVAALPETHDRAVTAAHRAIEGESVDFPVDAAQVSRIATAIAGPAPAVEKMPESLVAFLAARGGVIDQQGELSAIGAEALSRNRARRGRPDRRVPLDRAREAAEEAGYIGRAGETQVTTVADLLDAIDRELRGQPVYAREDLERLQPQIDHERQMAAIEDRVQEVARHAGPGVDDAIVRQAAEISLRDGTDAFDALESVLIRQEEPAARAAAGDVLPGWSDAELEAASAARGGEPGAAAGDPFDDPGAVPDVLGFAEDIGPFAPSIPAAAIDGDWQRAVSALRTLQGGEVRGILTNPATGPIDVPWGWYDAASDTGVGLAKIVEKHPEVLANLPEIVRALPNARRVQDKIVLESADHAAIVRLDYDDSAKTWLLTAYAWGPGEGPKGGKNRPGGGTSERSPDFSSDASSPPPAKGNVDDRADINKIDDDVDQLMADRADQELTVPGDDGPVRFGDMAEELQHDERLAEAIRSCPI